MFEMYESDNFLTDNFDPGTKAIANVLTLSDSIPNYTAHIGMLFMTYHFDAN